MDEQQKELAKVIEKYFGADAAYLDIDVFTLAKRIIEAGWTKPVRCKDCKCAYINSFSAASGVAVCKKWSNEAETAIVQQDDFCSYGERRDAE